ncbi:orotidine-5'-phosphate decarboxylase [Microbacterium sp. SSW1-59]|uniref:orotidine-5'-phosphate decarboxylase n=1 Tax=Microbacterium xanthum TaxID=3079794 RepID=UPI002AD4052B|nr:orotidine-5'-phosphate decarboxylase [Microbacterium sp. SSW1-59]MDZ8202434.1 orotidine-5'-phosphate decarboxylase [Microbacterium sp. SSW1-59]
MTGFGERVRGALAQSGPLCVGVDPHPGLLAAWGLPTSAEGVRTFGLRVVEAASASPAGIIKPQVSFFERFGSAGIAALEDVMRAGREGGLIVIADAKRGDIGSTMHAYAEAWLTPGSPLEADALTVNPYLGVGALSSAAELAYAHGKGLFALVATSNPEAVALQRSQRQDGRTVARAVLDELGAINADHTRAGEWGSIGAVVGATVSWAESGLVATDPPTPILAPGFGFQGARADDLQRIFGEAAPTVIASESRSILAAGPDRLVETIRERSEQYGSTP